MDQFLSKLNLQNLLRQFCCGIVFFVPLYLFVPCKIQWVWQNAGLADNSLKCIAVLAFIIGTVIYHLEKNLYSYAIQAIFEKCHDKKGGVILHLFIGILIISVSGISIAFLLSWWWSVMSFIILWTLIFLSVFAHSDMLIYPTQKLWEIESHSKNYTARDWAIADKVAVWSDFIHCVQSCCFAWLLGSGIAIHVTQECECCVSKENISTSCIVAICLLLIELGIDWHRYRHVLSITK